MLTLSKAFGGQWGRGDHELPQCSTGLTRKASRAISGRQNRCGEWRDAFCKKLCRFWEAFARAECIKNIVNSMFCSQLAFSIMAPFWNPLWENFGSHLDTFGPLGAPWGLQVDLQECSGHYPIPDLRKPWKKLFFGIPRGDILPWTDCYGTGFGHFGTPGEGSRLHGSAFQDFLNFRVC